MELVDPAMRNYYKGKFMQAALMRRIQMSRLGRSLPLPLPLERLRGPGLNAGWSLKLKLQSKGWSLT